MFHGQKLRQIFEPIENPDVILAMKRKKDGIFVQ